MPHWKKPYLTRRSTRILSYVVRQNYTLLETAGEACYLLKRMARANAPFQKANRRVDTISRVITSGFVPDPDTGMLRYKLWDSEIDDASEYPDIGVLTCTIQASATTVWEPAVDKYSFISDGEEHREEYAFEEVRDRLDADGNLVPDALWIIFNTPPFAATFPVFLTYGTINPLVNIYSMQPVRDNQLEGGYARSLFGFEQWISPSSRTPRIRRKLSPNAFLMAWPGVLSDFTITDGGLLRETQGSYWTSPDPLSPLISEHDVVIRQSTGERFQVTNFLPIMIESRLVEQHFDMSALDPRSSLYGIPYYPG